VNFGDDHMVHWSAAQHLERLRTMARGWYQPATPQYHSEPLRTAVLRGLDCWYAHDPQPPDWWWIEIGVPLLLGDILLCLKGACDRSYIERARPSFEIQRPFCDYTGANLVWVAWTRILYGILTDDPDLASQGYIAIGREVRIVPEGEGIQPDMSFHQHDKLFYSGGYGMAFVVDVSRLIAVATGTSYAWPPHLVARVVSYILDGCRWMVRGQTFDPSACGREITRQGHSAARFYAGLRFLAGVEHTRQSEADDAATIDPADGRSLVTGNRYFWCSDFMVQHRPSYYLSVRMTSRRILNADMTCGGEGRQCHHMAEGATILMRDGDEYRDIYPVWNWRQVPGTTVVQMSGEFDPDTLRGVGECAFAGGASDGSVGCAAMDFSRADLQARKAWFFFDEGLVALGAGISAMADAPVRTTLNQCRWRGPVYLAGTDCPLNAGEYRLVPGTTFWHDGTTYRLDEGTGTLRLGPQSGAWSNCGLGSPEPLTLNVLNAGLDHGLKPNGAAYAYTILPGIKADAAFADNPARFVIVCNTPVLQAVWHADDRRGHAVFYEPGTVAFPDGQRIGVDRSCIVLYHPNRDGTTELIIAQPEQRDGLITFRLEGRQQVAFGVSLPSREYAGSSQTIRWLSDC
jgi:chondroitin AC lyase